MWLKMEVVFMKPVLEVPLNLQSLKNILLFLLLVRCFLLYTSFNGNHACGPMVVIDAFTLDYNLERVEST